MTYEELIEKYGTKLANFIFRYSVDDHEKFVELLKETCPKLKNFTIHDAKCFLEFINNSLERMCKVKINPLEEQK